MDNLRQKLAALKTEENDLISKQSDVDTEVRNARRITDELQTRIQELTNSEKLLKLKLESENARLKKVEASLSIYESSVGENETCSINTNQNELTDDDIQAQLTSKREELRKIETDYNEVLLHDQHLQVAKQRKQDRAGNLEANIKKLEDEFSDIQHAFTKAESSDLPNVWFDEVEDTLREMRQNLEQATSAYDTSQREVARLDRQIDSRRTELQEQRRANESLKKELDNLCTELDSI